METVLPDTVQSQDGTRRRRRGSRRKARQYGRRFLRVVLFATAWILTIAGAYEVVATYASAVRDPDGNMVGGGLAVAALKFAVCLAAGGGCLFFAQRLRR